MITFANQHLWVLMFLPLIAQAILPIKKTNLGQALRIPFIKDLQTISSQKGFIPSKGSSFLSIYLIWILLVLSLMRPIIKGEEIKLPSKSRDVIMIIDISPSMKERDFIYNQSRQDRLTGVKGVATDFIKNRGSDKVGLILFATRAYLQAPITYDKNTITEVLNQTDAGMAGESTAIGDALGLGLKYLKDKPNKDKKVIILLTDGESNDGFLSVAKATELAQEEGVKIYTIGVGSKDNFFSAFFGSQGFDEKSLKEIARLTQGRYFSATSGRELAQVYKEIDKLEPVDNADKTVVEIKELFFIPALIAFILSAIFMLAYKRRLS